MGMFISTEGRNKTTLVPNDKALSEFEGVKQMVAECKYLYSLDETRSIHVDADASPEVYGGLVYHIDNNGEKQIVMVIFGSFDKVQSK